MATLILVLLAIIIVLAFMPLAKNQRADQPVVEYQINPMFTRDDVSLLQRVQDAAGPDMLVLCKIRFRDLLTPRAGTRRIDSSRNHELISNKRFDFLLCDAHTLQPRIVVDIDEHLADQQGHNRPDAIEAACRSAQLPRIRISSIKASFVDELRDEIQNKLSTPPAQTPGLSEPALPAATTESVKPEPANPPIETNRHLPRGTMAGPSCPKCHARMIRRVAIAGKLKGNEFWGCSQYPECRGVLPG